MDVVSYATKSNYVAITTVFNYRSCMRQRKEYWLFNNKMWIISVYTTEYLYEVFVLQKPMPMFSYWKNQCPILFAYTDRTNGVNNNHELSRFFSQPFILLCFTRKRLCLFILLTVNLCLSVSIYFLLKSSKQNLNYVLKQFAKF